MFASLLLAFDLSSLPILAAGNYHSDTALSVRDQVIWPSISTDLLALHLEIQVLVFDADEANRQKAQYVGNR